MTNKQLFYAIIYLFCCARLGETKSGCSIKFPIPFDNNQPMILQNTTSTFEFVIPYRGEIKLRDQEALVLACTEAKSVLKQSNSNLTQVKCAGGTTFSLGRNRFDFREFNCTKPSKGAIRMTNQKCGQNKGNIINIGYGIGRHNWLTLIRTCYDSSSGNSLYSEHVIYGQAIANHSKTNTRPSFSTQGVGKNPADLVYKREFQKGQFNKLLGSARLAEQYVNEKSYLARGHLAPDADFLYASWQFTTYYYINVVPQWQAINGGNWNALERIVRKEADKLNRELVVVTGSFGVLTLTDINENDVEMYLAPNNKVPIPKFVYKIIYDESSMQGIVLVSLNNPFLRGASEDDYLCEDVCQETGWYRPQWNKVSQGLIYCCEYSKFKAVVKTVPNLSIKQILRI